MVLTQLDNLCLMCFCLDIFEQSKFMNRLDKCWPATSNRSASGLKSVSYESGHVESMDVAARRAVMTGVNQLNQSAGSSLWTTWKPTS